MNIVPSCVNHIRLPLLALMALVSACDFGSEGILLAGVVVERDTSVPIEGIHVSTQTVGMVGNRSITAEALTDREGRFRFRSQDGALFVNSPPCYFSNTCAYNPAYSGGNVSIGENRTGIRIELIRRDTTSTPP